MISGGDQRFLYLTWNSVAELLVQLTIWKKKVTNLKQTLGTAHDACVSDRIFFLIVIIIDSLARQLRTNIG